MKVLSLTLFNPRPKSFLFLSFLSLLYITIQAQPSGRTTWQASSFVYATELNEVNRTSEFIIFPNDSIRWIQAGGSKIYDFEILSAEGTWTNLLEDGSMIYRVTRANLFGWIRFQREKEEITISLNFEQDGHNIMPYTFNVLNISN